MRGLAWFFVASGFLGTTLALAQVSTGPTSENRFTLAGGCFAVRSAATGLYVVRQGDGFAASAADLAAAEPFHFQATELGRYLLFGSKPDFLAAQEGLAGTVAEAATGGTPGGIASGLTRGRTDQATDTIATGPAGTATGRGSAVVGAGAASDLADWEVLDPTAAQALGIPLADGDFAIRLPATNQTLAAGEGGRLVLTDDFDGSAAFRFELTEGCAQFPEVEVNVAGQAPPGDTRGFIDLHGHMMAFEFIGGGVRCGRPWHRFGVDHALVDCPDHEPDGRAAILEHALSGTNPVEGHDTAGWPTFPFWPRHDSLTHEQVYYKWLERAWRGGLRLYVNLLVDNRQLCEVYPYRSRDDCNEMNGVRLQARRIRELENYIDAQSGGPGKGWFRIVLDPSEARRVIEQGKLAAVVGIEVSVPFDCGLDFDMPLCDEAQIDAGLAEAFDVLGVREMEIVNKFDNALTGVTGDTGETGVVVNNGNFNETGRFWQMETCGENDPAGSNDKPQLNVHDESGSPDELTGRDTLVAGVLEVSGRSGAAPLYPPTPHCNVRGLTNLGRHLIGRMIDRGMIFDPDHMSARARRQALDLLEERRYSGVVSSHSWADDTIYPRIWALGGMVTPFPGSPGNFAAKWRQNRDWAANTGFLFALGYGADTNGFAGQPGPPTPPASVPGFYPFTGLGGVTIDKQQSGTRPPYDVNIDGVAHYGLYPDWIEQVRRAAENELGLGKGAEIFEDMARAAEAYLQMWERAWATPSRPGGG